MGKKSDERNPAWKAVEGKRVGGLAAEAPPRSAEDILHELQVHQIELEMQNEELQRAYRALEEVRDRYVDLYEFAPLGYLTLSRTALIEEANLTSAALLGVERKRLLRRRFDGYVSPEDRDCWNRHFLRALLREEGCYECELAVMRKDGTPFHAHLHCLRRKAGESVVLRVVLTDVSKHRKAQGGEA